MAAVLPGSLQPPLYVAVAKAAADRGRFRHPLAPQQDSAWPWNPRRENPFPFLFLTAVTSCSCASPVGPRGRGLNGQILWGGDALSRGRHPFKLGGNVAAAASDDTGTEKDDGDEEEEGGTEWEVEMKNRVGELEEMNELEKRAQELQSRGAVEGGNGEEETEEEKRNRVRRELEKLAKEQNERRQKAKLMFELGQKAYGRGMYWKSIEFLEGALTFTQKTSLVGGEIQIWLAMAYEANNRHQDCIELYKQLEKLHPNPSIRRQAAELRYIMQAPKLKISKEEMVTIPLIGSSYDRYAVTWSNKYKDQERRKMTGSSSSPSRYFWGDFIPWKPPTEWQKSRAFWFAVTLWLALIGIALLLQS